ncbi:MAG: M20 family metallopeptidase [Chloroflexota bacterium]
MLSLNEITQQTPQLVALLRELVEIESPSSEKAAVDGMSRAVAGHLERLGARVERLPQAQAGDLVIGRFHPDDPRPGILIIGHMDTVHPLGTLARMPCEARDGRLHGPGTLDMKAGIAIALFTAGLLQQHGLSTSLPLTMLFTSDEETGSLVSRPVIERLARQAALVLCMEPGMPGGGLKTWRKGVGEFLVTAYGRAAHAGSDHAQGRNAIEELAHQVIAIQRLTDYSRGTTLNAGVVKGGTASNVVPEQASLEVDLRVMDPAEVGRITQALQGLQPALEGTRLEVQGSLNRPPMPRDERMIAAFEKARAIAAGIGIELSEGGTGGGSDANFVAPLGVAVLDGLSGWGDGMHSEREYVQIDSLGQRAALLAALLTRW